MEEYFKMSIYEDAFLSDVEVEDEAIFQDELLSLESQLI